ncbi:hypothetical protein PPTG_04103 [Phytophthora nicotianae INRA-310]|uniref:Uncharacterized protein n=1 Tax=Phytophthora nicotianae (strain INRA-310) TaxID=761204 RepID=W2QZ83_PHYN3|nr:hypothetical protein PPTG_04103 [Phytophthora nicotianae INRA-310]ETN18522.1 hypothetical protein PPTG_04103 [Phytophthora nicotianae INRA-310]
MADVAAEHEVNGWHEVEQTLTALELPPVPPTSDPQRLLGYVLHILPRFTEMEMLATHLRLYASSLEQDMEQVKSHVRLLTREAAGEREKKQFLERYAAQVVKERNDLLHSRGSLKKKAAGASHFVWHNCCKKNTNHAMDLAPSILAFRGEKLQDATKQIESLQEEVRNQELLRIELDFLLKKTQREHDSKAAADRKHIQQLEKQILQRSALYSSLERKLYEVELVLAQHDKTKEEALSVVSNRVRESLSRNAQLEGENANLQEQVRGLSFDRDRLTELLEETTESKELFAEQIDDLTEKCRSLESEVEALRSEIDMLQSKDINDIRSQYAVRIDRLQKDNAAREQKLRQEVDRVRQELKKRDEALAQTFGVQQSTTSESSRHPRSGQTSGLGSIPLSGDDAQWSDGIFDDDRQFESDEVGSSLSRSQLSVSHGSFGSSSSAGRGHFNLSKEVGAANTNFSAKNDQGHASRQSYSSSSKQGYSRELDAVSRDLSKSSKELEAESQQDDADIDAPNEPFDWETFIDSVSDMSSLPNEHPMSTIPQSMDFSTSTIHFENSVARVSDSELAGSRKVRADSFEEEHQQNKEASSHSFDTIKVASLAKCRSFNELEFGEDEEEKESENHDTLMDNESEQHDADGAVDNSRMEHGRHDDHEGNITGEHAQNDFARDLYQMLNGLEQKRKEEEQKASLAEKALLKFQQLQQGVQALNLSPDS